MAWYMRMLMRIRTYTQLCAATIVLYSTHALVHETAAAKVLIPAVLDGLGGVLECGPGGDMDPVLAVSGSERGIQGNTGE